MVNKVKEAEGVNTCHNLEDAGEKGELFHMVKQMKNDKKMLPAAAVSEPHRVRLSPMKRNKKMFGKNVVEIKKRLEKCNGSEIMCKMITEDEVRLQELIVEKGSRMFVVRSSEWNAYWKSARIEYNLLNNSQNT